MKPANEIQRSAENILQQYRTVDLGALYDDLRQAGEHLPAKRRASTFEVPTEHDADKRQEVAHRLVSAGAAPRAFAELTWHQEQRIRRSHDSGLRVLYTIQTNAAERTFLTGVPPAQPTHDRRASTSVSPRHQVDSHAINDDAQDVPTLLPSDSPSHAHHGATSVGGEGSQDGSSPSLRASPSLPGTGQPARRGSTSGPDAVSNRRGSAAGNAPERLGSAATGLSGTGTAAGRRGSAAAGFAGGRPAAQGAVMNAYLRQLGAGPGRPMPKGLVMGHSAQGSMVPSSYYRAPQPPVPPVRPESLGGFGFLALRPAPPLLWWRLYQRASLNPSPAFEIRFFRRQAPKLRMDGSDPAAILEIADKPAPPFYDVDEEPPTAAGTTLMLLEDRPLTGDVEGMGVEGMGVGGALAGPQVEELLVEVLSSPQTQAELMVGRVRAESSSSLVTRMSLLRHVLAGCTSWAAYVPDVGRAVIRKNAEMRAKTLAKIAAAKAQQGENGTSNALALAELSWGDLDGGPSAGMVPPGVHQSAASDRLNSVLDLSDDPLWDDMHLRGVMYEPYHLAQASTSQFPADGEPLKLTNSGAPHVTLTAQQLLGDTPAGTSSSPSGQAQRDSDGPSFPLKPEEGGEGYGGLQSHWERSTLFWDTFNLYWDTAPWYLYSAQQDLEALGRASASGQEKPGLRLCGCGCGRPWGAHVPFPAYSGGGLLHGHEATGWQGTEAYCLRRALVMHQREVLVPDARNVSPIGIVANAVLDFTGGWLFDSQTLSQLQSSGVAKHARVLRLSAWHGQFVTPTLLLNALLAMPKLQHLHAPAADAWADASLCATLASSIPSMAQLRSLDLSLSNITDAGIITLVKAAPEIRCLHLASCVNISNAAILEIGKLCRHLHTLDISWCYKIDGYGIAALLSECGGMQRLNIKGLGRGFGMDVVSVNTFMSPGGTQGRDGGTAGLGHAVGLDSEDSLDDDYSPAPSPTAAGTVPANGRLSRSGSRKSLRPASGESSRSVSATAATSTGAPAALQRRRPSCSGSQSGESVMDEDGATTPNRARGRRSSQGSASPGPARTGTGATRRPSMAGGGSVHGPRAMTRGGGPKVVEHDVENDYSLNPLAPSYHFLLTSSPDELPGVGLHGRPFLLHRLLGARVELLVRLQEVDLEAAVGVSDSTVISLVRNSEGAIRRLRLAHCTSITAASSTAIALFCPNLTHLSLQGCTGLQSPLVDTAIAASLAVQAGFDREAGLIPDHQADRGVGWGIVAKFREAERAGKRNAASPLKGGKNIFEETGRADVRQGGYHDVPPPQWVHMNMLDLSGCVHVDSTDVTAFIQGCPELRDLRLSGVHDVSDASFGVIQGAGGQYLGALKALRLGFQSGISDDLMRMLGHNCPDLHVLEVDHCMSVSDMGLAYLASGCIQLREFRANACSDAITMAGILKLAQACRQLRVLEVGRAVQGALATVSPSAQVPASGRPASVLQGRPATALDPTRAVGSAVPGSSPAAAAAGHGDSAVPPGPDITFTGTLFEFLLCLGVCCPYLQQLDLTGRRPATRGKLAQTNVVAQMKARSEALMARFGLTPSAAASVPPGSAPPAADAGSGEAGTAVGAFSTVGEDELLRLDGEEAETVLPNLQRLVLRLSGPMTARQLHALLATAPALISCDLTDVKGIAVEDVKSALGRPEEKAAAAPYVHVVVEGVPGSEAESQHVQEVEALAGLPPRKVPAFTSAGQPVHQQVPRSPRLARVQGEGDRSSAPPALSRQGSRLGGAGGAGDVGTLSRAGSRADVSAPAPLSRAGSRSNLDGGGSRLSIGSRQSGSGRVGGAAGSVQGSVGEGAPATGAAGRRKSMAAAIPPPPAQDYPLRGNQRTAPLLPYVAFAGWSATVPQGTPAVPASHLAQAAQLVRHKRVAALDSALFPPDLRDKKAGLGVTAPRRVTLAGEMAQVSLAAPSVHASLSAHSRAVVPGAQAAPPPTLPQQLTQAGHAALQQAAGDSILLMSRLLHRAVPSDMVPHLQPAQQPPLPARALGWDPIPGACFARAATLVQKRLATERIAANRIRKLVLHGLRKAKEWFWTLMWRLRLHKIARVQWAARRIQKTWRRFVKWLAEKRRTSAVTIQVFWRRVLFIDRIRKRVIAALTARRAAMTKQLAVALMAVTVNRAVQRVTWDILRLNSLIERWKDERRINRLRGLGPVYGHDGRLKVQFALPEDGPEILGSKEEAMEEAAAMEVIIRANMVTSLQELVRVDPLVKGSAARPPSSRTVHELVTDALGRGSKLARPPSQSFNESRSVMSAEAMAEELTEHSSSEAQWEYGYAYRFVGLQLAEPKRVRRRRSFAKRLQEWREQQAQDAHKKEEVKDFMARTGETQGTAEEGVMRRFGLATLQQANAAHMSVIRAKRNPRPGTADGRPLPTRPHRQRRNSFDLLDLSKTDPDLPDFDEGWESYDSADEPENAEFLRSIGESQQLPAPSRPPMAEAGEFGVDTSPPLVLTVTTSTSSSSSSLKPPAGATGAKGGGKTKKSVTIALAAPPAIGENETRLLLDGAAEDRGVDADALLLAERTLSKGAPTPAALLDDPAFLAMAAYPPASQQGGRRANNTHLMSQSVSSNRSESVYARRVAHARDHALTKLARLHVALRATRNAIATVRTGLEQESWSEADLRRARDAYERSHGEGSSKSIGGWVEMDTRARVRVQQLFSYENKAAALEEEIRICTDSLKAAERKLLLAKRQKEIRQISVATARAADPSLLALDPVSKKFRLADDAPSKLMQLYGSSGRPSPPASHPSYRPASLYYEEEEKKGVEEGESIGREPEVLMMARDEQHGGVVVALPVLAGSRKETHAVEADTGAAYGTDVSLAIVGFRKDARYDGAAKLAALRASADAEGKVEVNGRKMDLRDAEAVAVLTGDLHPQEGHVLGVRAATSAALAENTHRPATASEGKLLPIKHSPYVVKPGKVTVVLPNPDGIGGQTTADFGTGALKRTTLSKVLAVLGVASAAAGSFQEEAALGGLIAPLTMAARPLEGMVALLGPLAFIQAMKKRLPLELRQYMGERKGMKEKKQEIELGVQRRLRNGVVRKIQYCFRSFLGRKMLRAEIKRSQEHDDEATLEAERKSGRAEAPNCATANRALVRATVNIQAAYRRFSSKLFVMRAKRAQAVARAKDLLAQLGQAISNANANVDSPTAAAGMAGIERDRYRDEALELGRAYALAGQIKSQLAEEQQATKRMRRASLAFDKNMRKQQAEMDEAAQVLSKLGEAIAAGAELGNAHDDEFSAFERQFERGEGVGFDHAAVTPGARSRVSQSQVDPLLRAYQELAQLMALDPALGKKGSGAGAGKKAPSVRLIGVDDGDASDGGGTLLGGGGSSPRSRGSLLPAAQGASTGDAGAKKRRGSYYAALAADGAEEGANAGAGPSAAQTSGAPTDIDEIKEDDSDDEAEKKQSQGVGMSDAVGLDDTLADEDDDDDDGAASTSGAGNDEDGEQGEEGGGDEGSAGGSAVLGEESRPESSRLGEGAEAHAPPPSLRRPVLDTGAAGTGLGASRAPVTAAPGSRPPPLTTQTSKKSILKKENSSKQLALAAAGSVTPSTVVSEAGRGSMLSRMFGTSRVASGSVVEGPAGTGLFGFGRKASVAASKRSVKSSNKSIDAKARAAAKAAEEQAKRDRYYNGNMPFAELVAYRRQLDDHSFMARLEVIHAKALNMERWLRGWLLESLPLLSDDMQFRYGMLAADARDWVRHWSRVRDVMSAQASAIPTLTDPLIHLRRARLLYRIQLLNAVLDVKRTQSLDYAGTISNFKLMAGWAERVSFNLTTRARKDAAVVKRVKRQLPAAQKVLLYIERRLLQLNLAMSAWKRSGISQKARTWKAADIMKASMGEVGALGSIMGMEGGETSQSEGTDGGSPTPSRRLRGAGPSRESVEDEGGVGMTMISPTASRALSQPAPFMAGAGTESGRSLAWASGYDWRSTDEWVIRTEPAQGTSGPAVETWVHMPTGFVSATEPTAPPPGFVSPFTQQDVHQIALNPSLLPTRIGIDEAVAPPIMSPSLIPSAIRPQANARQAPAAVPTAMGTVTLGAGAAGGDLPRPMQLTGPASVVGSAVAPRTPAEAVDVAAIAAGVQVGGKGASKSTVGTPKTGKTPGDESGTEADPNNPSWVGARPKAAGETTTGDVNTVAATGMEHSDIAAAIARSRAIARKGGFDVEDTKAEMWWLQSEAQLVREAIVRMEAFMKAVFQQHADRAERELRDAEMLRASVEQLSSLREEERRVQTELVQVQQEVASQRYHAANSEALHRLSKLSAVSYPRFGRLEALPPHPRVVSRMARLQAKAGISVGGGLDTFAAAGGGARSEDLGDIIQRRLNRRKAQKRRQAERDRRKKERNMRARAAIEGGYRSRAAYVQTLGRSNLERTDAAAAAEAKANSAQAVVTGEPALGDPHVVLTKKQRRVRRMDEMFAREERRVESRLEAARREAEIAAARAEIDRYAKEHSEVDERKVRRMQKHIAKLIEQREKTEEEALARETKKQKKKAWFSWGGKNAASTAPVSKGSARMDTSITSASTASASGASSAAQPAPLHAVGIDESAQAMSKHPAALKKGNKPPSSRRVMFAESAANQSGTDAASAVGTDGAGSEHETTDAGAFGPGRSRSSRRISQTIKVPKKGKGKKASKRDAWDDLSSVGDASMVGGASPTGSRVSLPFDTDLLEEGELGSRWTRPHPGGSAMQDEEQELEEGAEQPVRTPRRRGASNAEKSAKKEDEKALKLQQAARAQHRASIASTSHVDMLGAADSSAVKVVQAALGTAQGEASGNTSESAAANALLDKPTQPSSITHYVDDGAGKGATIGGLALSGVAKGGRFGRYISKPSDVARAEAKREATEKALRNQILLKTSGDLLATRLVQDKAAEVNLALGGGEDGVLSSKNTAGKEDIDLSEWYIPARRPPVVHPTPENLAYYSIAGDGEEIGNPGFWYWGRDKGTVTGLFGVKIRIEPVGGYDSGEESASIGSDSDTDDGVDAVTPFEHGRQMARLRAQAIKQRKYLRRARRAQALRARLEGKGEALQVGLTAEQAAQRFDQMALYTAIAGEHSDAIRRRALLSADPASRRALPSADPASAAAGAAGGAPDTTQDMGAALDDATAGISYNRGEAELQRQMTAKKSFFGSSSGSPAKLSTAPSARTMRKFNASTRSMHPRDDEDEREGAANLGDDSVRRNLENVDRSGEAEMGRLLEAAYEEAMFNDDEVDEAGQVIQVAARSLRVKKDSYRRIQVREGEVKHQGPEVVHVAAPWAKLAQAAGFGHVISEEEAAELERQAQEQAIEAARVLAAENEARAKAAKEARELEAAEAEADVDDSESDDWAGAADYDSELSLITASSDDEETIRAKRGARERKVAAVVADAADTPRWWVAVGLDDEDALAVHTGNAHDTDEARSMRGFGGGILCARSEEEYASRLAAQEYKTRSRLSEIIAKRDLVQSTIDSLLAKLEKDTGNWQPFGPPAIVKTLMAQSVQATDAHSKTAWEEEQMEKAKGRKAAKDQAEHERKRRAGMTDEDVKAEEEEKVKARMDLYAEARPARRRQYADENGLDLDNPAHADAIAYGVDLMEKEEEDKFKEAELAEFNVVRAGEEFRSGGFQGIVAPDGALLEWAGDGTQFLLDQWKARYRVKPWVVDAAILKFVTSKKGQAIGSEEELMQALMTEGATVLIRQYKLGETDLPLSGFEAARLSLRSRKELAALEAIKKAAEAAKIESERLRKALADRQAKIDSQLGGLKSKKQKAQDEKKQQEADRRKKAAEAAEQAKDQYQKFARAARNLMLNIQKTLADYRLKRNKNLQSSVASVRKHATAALGVIEGISDVHFTFGVFADADWAQAQSKEYDKADPEASPFYLKLQYNLGSVADEPVYLWYSRTTDITKMITHLVWAPTADSDSTADLLRSKGYRYITHPALFPGYGLWYQVGGGKAVTALTASFDSAQRRLMESKGFKAVDGLFRSDYISPNTTLWFRSGKQKKKSAKALSEIVKETENAAIEAKIAYMEAKINASKEAKKGKGGAENQTLQEGLARAKADYASKKKETEDLREGNMIGAAIDFLGLKEGDVTALKTAYNRMDASIIGGGNQDGEVDLSEFFKYCDVDRTPLADSIFFFLDGHFSGEVLTFGTFLRTVCSFCMFGSKELVNWTFSVVAVNVVAKAEGLHDPPQPGRAGARGIDRKRNRSVYWEEAVAWSNIQARDPASGRISVQAFAQLLYSIHPRTSALAMTVKRAVSKANDMAVGGDLRLFQFKNLCSEFPTLLSPIFLLQTRMRQRFMGESWWATKRQLFSDARDIVKEQLSIETRLALLRREEERAKKVEDMKEGEKSGKSKG